MIELKNKKDCTACGACYNICAQQCIRMSSDDEGFLYPEIDTDKCVQCGLCEQVCPVINGKNERFGDKPAAYIAWSNNSKFLEESTSGGVFASIAAMLLQKNGFVYGAAYNKDNVVEHIEISKLQDLKRLNRSKYVQSNTQKTYQSAALHLRNKEKVLYSGTPCQIYGLLSYLKLKRISTENLITMDVICHGTPSPKLLKEYIKWQEKDKKSNVTSIAMREKRHPRRYFSVPVTKVNFGDGKSSELAANMDYYGRFFLGEISSRPSCYSCSFKTIGRISDLTIGDCWFSRAITGRTDIPFDVTLCLAHTEKGKELLECAESGLTTVLVDLEKAVKCNGGMIYKSAIPDNRRAEFFKELGDTPLDELAEKYFPTEPKHESWGLHKIKELIKMLPVVYEKYYFSNKKKEFDNRCKRVIPPEAYVKKTI
ncbi:4Fe-4S dicluster domain-containing protein [Oscillospiraceae bacterium HV4-5-C5C]|nr:4Fe-4S dicluster domain-containing protein [Oscillospiraceae bacterium HV4-5-C5C]